MPPDTEHGMQPPRILVIDDDEAMLRSVGRALRSEDFGDALLCPDPRGADELLRSHNIGVVLLDLVMPHISGETLLGSIAAEHPSIPVIVVSAVDQVDTAVRCVKAGAFDYLVKPVDFSRLLATIAQALRQRELRVENLRLRELVQNPRLHCPECFADMVTRSPSMHAMFRYVEAIAPSPEPALIVGETGVGKELVAHALHRASGREGALLSVNVAGIDENAFADTLFGHTKGAFTGAERDREGMIERAGAGTLFLDEIGDLGSDMQTKLLRLLQEGEYFPLGSDQCRRSRCRIVAATNRDLRAGMREGRFRDDLYYRLHAHLVRVPPLRERLGDLPLLVDAFLRDAASKLGKPVPTVPKELHVHLATYAFPGNVRELRAMVVDAVARHEKGVLSLASFREHLDRAAETAGKMKAGASGEEGRSGFFGRDLPTAQQGIHMLIAEALKRTDGNQGAAARLLGISRRTVSRYVNETDDSPIDP